MLGDEIRAADVERRNRVEVLRRGLGGGGMAGEAGAVHEHVERPALGHGSARGVNIGHVERQRLGCMPLGPQRIAGLV